MTASLASRHKTGTRSVRIQASRSLKATVIPDPKGQVKTKTPPQLIRNACWSFLKAGDLIRESALIMLLKCILNPLPNNHKSLKFIFFEEKTKTITLRIHDYSRPQTPIYRQCNLQYILLWIVPTTPYSTRFLSPSIINNKINKGLSLKAAQRSFRAWVFGAKESRWNTACALGLPAVRNLPVPGFAGLSASGGMVSSFF